VVIVHDLDDATIYARSVAIGAEFVVTSARTHGRHSCPVPLVAARPRPGSRPTHTGGSSQAQTSSERLAAACSTR
jgi:hypothetical protein